jgi:SAM-dependent methyltransferase
MGVRDRLMAGVARQLGQPTGIRGRLIGRRLNRGNSETVLAAVTATGLGAGQSAADIGFGGGVGLSPLLERVGPGGLVHGVEISDTMLAVARSRYSQEIAQGRLSLHAGDMAALPLPDDSLDAVITVNTVYFVADLEQAFAEIARVLRPGCRAVIGVGDPTAMASMPFTAHGFTLRPIDHLANHLRTAGFDEPRDQRVGAGDRAFHLLVADLETAG